MSTVDAVILFRIKSPDLAHKSDSKPRTRRGKSFAGGGGGIQTDETKDAIVAVDTFDDNLRNCPTFVYPGTRPVKEALILNEKSHDQAHVCIFEVT